MDRRTFLWLPLVLRLGHLGEAQSSRSSQANSSERRRTDLAAIERARVLAAATRYLAEQPITITASSSPRSAGGLHDFFSEGDYWWPDPANPDGPYIQRDGMTNPDNFVAHRRAMVRLSLHVPALAAAWKLTHEDRYAARAVKHLRAWFVDDATRMTPHLLYSQAIHGRFTGRGTGIIDTVHLVEVARAVTVLDESRAFSAADRGAIRQWFSQYLTWMTTHQYGIDEREAKNNHGTCWVMQVAEFARLVQREDLLAYCRDRFKTVLVPNQIAPDGSFPEELRRTKPYGYSLFNLDAMTTVCQILSPAAGNRQPATAHAQRAEASRDQDSLWFYELPDGRGIKKAVAFLFPFIEDKKRWPHKPDIMYFDQWPMRHPLLLFAGLALGEQRYLDLWKRLPADSTVEEVITKAA